MLAYLFPGQGSQERGMGHALFDAFPDLVANADEVLGYSIKQLCLYDENQLLNQTLYTQPAIYVVNALYYLHQLESSSTLPDYLAGHSLGEYNALLATEVFDFQTGLQLVKKRAELMQQMTNGGMAAVVGLELEDLRARLENANLAHLTIANHNTATQFILSGSKEDLSQAQKIFAAKVAFIPLKVSGAFHSPFMQEASAAFATYLQDFSFATPLLPVLANLDALPYHPANIVENLARQIDHPVLWTSIIQSLLRYEGIQFKEIGHGTALTRMISQYDYTF